MPTATVLITADVDDGYERVGTATWFNAGMSNDLFGFLSGLAYNLGDRFASLGVPQGATISSAILTLDITLGAGTATGTMYGVKQGNASAFSNGNLPSGVPKTSASSPVSWSTGLQKGARCFLQ